jgi:hypothetical protein
VPRTLTIFFPGRKTEYWFTALVFRPGDKLERNGASWVVTSVGDFGDNGDGKHMTVTLRPDGDGDSHRDDGNFAPPS